MICVSYTRSRIKFGEAISIAEQNDKIAAFVKGRRMTVEKRFSDRKEDENADEGFLEMKEAGINREFDCVVFWSMMYFGNDPLIGYNLLLHTFIPAGIDFAVVNDNFISIGQSAEEIEEYLYNKYKERRLIPTNRNAVCARANRRNTLYGYEKHGNDYVIDKAVEPIVREIFSFALDGKSVKEICTILNNKGAECPQVYLCRVAGVPEKAVKKEWENDQLKKILRDTRYKGVCPIIRNGVTSEVSLEGYITAEEYDRIQGLFPPVERSARSENPLLKLIYDKDSHIRLYMGDYLNNGGSYYYMSKIPPDYAAYKKKVMTVDSVLSEVKRLLEKECAMAKRIKAEIESFNGQAEVKIRREKFTDEISRNLDSLVNIVDKAITPTLEETQIGEAEHLTETLRQTAKAMNDMELAFSAKNPWIKMYATLKPDDVLTLDFCRKYITEILLDRFEKVILIPKQNEWKLLLPEYWLEV